MARCVNCGELYEEDLTETVEGLVCNECMENDYNHCDECGRIHLSDGMYWFNDSL